MLLGRKTIVYLRVVVLSLIIFQICSAALAASNRTQETSGPELVTVLLPDWSTFDHEAKEWIFTALPLQVARGNWQVRLRATIIRETGTRLEHNEQEWQDALVYGDSAQVARELEEYLDLRLRNLLGQLTSAEQKRFEDSLWRIHARIKEKERQEARTFVIKINVPAQVVDPGKPYLLDITFEAREQTKPTKVKTFTVTKQIWPVVLPSSISDNSIWLRADLHLHSRYSDGGVDNHLYAIRDTRLAGRGYRIAYMTDHVGVNVNDHLSRSVCLCPPQGGSVLQPPCNVANTWSCYVTNTQRVSVPTGISFFPGVELSAAHSTDGEGHALGYGITTFPMRWGSWQVFDLSDGPQGVIDVLDQNNSAQPSSAGIAHPTGWYDWPWLVNHSSRTNRQRGMELMSGAQTNFSITSPPMLRWRDETHWLVNNHPDRPVFTQGWFPSVRTGSDLDPYNDSKYYTHVLLPVTAAEWNDSARTWANRRQLVDNALRNGQTIASLRGSWGRVAINGLLPGAIQRGLAANSTLNMALRLNPSVNGTAEVRLFRGHGTLDFSEDIPVTAGVEVTRTFTRTFPGGDQYYWLFVDIKSAGSNDVIYTTPIFLSSNP